MWLARIVIRSAFSVNKMECGDVYVERATSQFNVPMERAPFVVLLVREGRLRVVSSFVAIRVKCLSLSSDSNGYVVSGGEVLAGKLRVL